MLTGVGVPCAPINSIAQLLDHPHTKASGIIVEYEHQAAGRLKGVGHPVLINGTERRAGRPPPTLGQHTDDVLGEIGLSREMIGELRQARVSGEMSAALRRSLIMGASTDTAFAALKIGGRVAYERLARPKARRFDDVPCSPYAVTPEWLTAVLCGKVPGAAVTQVEVKAASAGTHERHRLKVSYNEEGRRAGLPVSIFTKSLPSIVTRMIGGFNGTARVEGSFFTQIRPELEIEAPLCYHSAYDRRTFAAIHLLEDLVATKSATFCNHKTDVSRAMADDMVDLLASLHGQFYADPTLAERYRWLAAYPRWFTIGAAKMGTEYYTGKAFDAAAHVIPPEVHGAPRARSGRQRCAHWRCMTASRKG